ncbi:MAG: EamA family transporter [Anaerolineae bacterium]
MATTAIVLVLIASAIHASWNLMARNSRTEGAFFDRMLPFVAAVGFLPAAIGQAFTGSMTPTAWLCAAISGVFCGLYFLSLGKAYESADFTTVYPVARSLPVLLVAVGDAFRGAVPTAVGWLGMVLVVGGCLMAPLRSRRDVTLGRYWNRSSSLMVATALGTVGYTLFDKRATEVVQRGPVSAAIYDYYFTLFFLHRLLPAHPPAGHQGQASSLQGAALAAGSGRDAQLHRLFPRSMGLPDGGQSQLRHRLPPVQPDHGRAHGLCSLPSGALPHPPASCAGDHSRPAADHGLWLGIWH